MIDLLENYENEIKKTFLSIYFNNIRKIIYSVKALFEYKCYQNNNRKSLSV